MYSTQMQNNLYFGINGQFLKLLKQIGSISIWYFIKLLEFGLKKYNTLKQVSYSYKRYNGIAL